MPDVIKIMQRHNVSVGQLARVAERSIETVVNWRTGVYAPPRYIELTIDAVGRNLKPLDHAAMYGYSDTIADVLGVPKETQWQWRYDGKFPTVARLAVAAAIKPRTPPLTPSDKRILQRVNIAGIYFRTAGGWRARPIMGRPPPVIKIHTPTSLIHHGYLQSKDGRLTLTEKGKSVIYGK